MLRSISRSWYVVARSRLSHFLVNLSNFLYIDTLRQYFAHNPVTSTMYTLQLAPMMQNESDRSLPIFQSFAWRNSFFTRKPVFDSPLDELPFGFGQKLISEDFSSWTNMFCSVNVSLLDNQTQIQQGVFPFQTTWPSAESLVYYFHSRHSTSTGGFDPFESRDEKGIVSTAFLASFFHLVYALRLKNTYEPNVMAVPLPCLDVQYFEAITQFSCLLTDLVNLIHDYVGPRFLFLRFIFSSKPWR